MRHIMFAKIRILIENTPRGMAVPDAVPDQGSAGPVAYFIRGAPSLRTCNILLPLQRVQEKRCTWGKTVPTVFASDGSIIHNFHLFCDLRC